MAGKSKVLVIGGTGHLGKYIVEASSKAGHPTFALVRESTVSHPQKSNLIESFKSYGVTLVYVCILQSHISTHLYNYLKLQSVNM
ncbi:hypothetical protein Ahy_Scaffold1g106743 isoform G [Arachis hypogaea]|uniref:NmrA-like domain-containing protein n=1 Tax=Arachis hypogaea TaxID=3818 RepID=A0A444WRV4_ARAHY|nr:hypothetical protein Ahy_Scaffold1g106743 isoform G [Arachis hypogaea]